MGSTKSIKLGALEMRGFIEVPGKGRSPVRITICEPVHSSDSVVGARVMGHPLLDRSIDIFADTPIDAFGLAQQFVLGAIGDRRLLLPIARDGGWSESFRDQRNELKIFSREKVGNPSVAYWEGPSGNTAETTLSMPEYLERCQRWAVRIDAPDFVTIPLAVTGLTANSARETAEYFIADIAKNRGWGRSKPAD